MEKVIAMFKDYTKDFTDEELKEEFVGFIESSGN